MQTAERQLVAGRYLLQEPFEEVGPVTLYHALDTHLKRPVTVQMVGEDVARDPSLSSRFLKHQQIASTLHHPHVLAVYDAGEWGGRPFSVMPRYDGQPVSSLYAGEAASPDVSTALKVTRQAAEALQYCRDAGLDDWEFSHEAVRVSNSGDACLALIERLAADASTLPTDTQSLGGLLRFVLFGATDPKATSRLMLGLPGGVLALLNRLSPGSLGGLSTAGEVARAIAEIEAASSSSTQAYISGEASLVAGEALLDDPLKRSEAPTLAADAVRAVPPAVTGPYVGPPAAAAPTPRGGVTVTARRRSPLTALALLAGLLLLVGLLVFFWPRPSGVASSTQEQAALQTATPPPGVPVPSFLGMRLDEASAVAEESGLSLALGDAVNSDFPPDTVAGQFPDPGIVVQSGSVITLSMSLGAAAPPPPVVQPPAEQPPKQEPPKGKKDNGKKGNEKGRDKDDDD